VRPLSVWVDVENVREFAVVVAYPEPNVVVAAEYTSPLVPTARLPTESEERRREEEIVDEAPPAKKPPVRPRMVEVELYPVLTVNGKAKDEMVIGDEPMMTPWVQDDPPEQERVVVATLPSLAGEPLEVVQYESCPIVSAVEVETEFAYELRSDWRGMT
jgi:hypothetical protein